MARAPLVDDGASQYEMDSQFDSEEYASEDDQEQTEDRSMNRRASLYSSASTSDDNDAHLQAAENAMGTLQTLHSSSSNAWKRALTHRSGVVVYVSKEKSYAGGAKTGKGGAGSHFAPVFKGEHEIKGFGPAAVFGVVGTRKLWDDWYNEGNLVENLNDTTSLTYMSMKGIVGSSTRDLSLVERVAGNATGTILFVSTSVTTPKVPRVSGRVRAAIALNGWVLEPIPGGTKVTYYLHVNVKTFVPSFAAAKYLARRPTCIARIDEYLQSHGPPPMATVDSTSNAPAKVPDPRRRRDSTASKRSSRSRAESTASVPGALPIHVMPNTDAASYGELQKAQKLFKALLSAPAHEWTSAVDHRGNKIYMRKREGDLLPVVKGEALVEGVTTEQVLGSILSTAARREWDPRFAAIGVVNLDNAIDQGTYVESHKAIYPSLGARHYVIARGVDRDDTSTDNGQILLVSRSTRVDITNPKNSTKGQMDVSGWLIEDHSDRSVKITYIAQLDVKETLKPFVFKILISELARVPRGVADFIDDTGYAPFFVRWGEGPAQLIGDNDGDLKIGKSVFRVSGGGEGTMSNGQQKCWLQYSDKMYERGVDVIVEPANACTIGRVEGLPRTLEFTWSEAVKDGAKITLVRARGDGAEDVYVDGQFLDRVVAMETPSANGAGVGMSRRKSSRKAVPAVLAAVAAPVAVEMSKKQSNGYTTDKPKSALSNGNGSSSSVVSTPTRSAPIPSAPILAPVVQQQQQQATVVKAGAYPEDACLIISPDLYFTRSQVKIFAIGLVAAWAVGKVF